MLAKLHNTRLRNQSSGSTDGLLSRLNVRQRSNFGSLTDRSSRMLEMADLFIIQQYQFQAKSYQRAKCISEQWVHCEECRI